MFTRTYAPNITDMSIRGDGRLLQGYAVPFDIEAVVNDGFGDYVERFRKGAFRNVVKDPARVELRYQHDGDGLMSWLGNATLLREDDRGLYGEWKLDASDRGKQVAYKIHDGQLPGLSISFIPAKDETDIRISDGLQRVTRTLVKQVDHVAAVRTPAYQPLEPLVVRSARPKSSVDALREWRASVRVTNERPS